MAARWNTRQERSVMALADYAHWNEDAEYMWWHEEGKHDGSEEPCDPDPDRYVYEEVDHLSVDECLADGNFNTYGAEGDWVCSTCYDSPTFVRLPDGTFAVKPA
jgi:hypothetical protein